MIPRTPHLARAAALVLTLASACSQLPVDDGSDITLRSGEILAPYGALEPRIVALDAFAGRHEPVTLRMERNTIEGVRIVYVLEVRTGAAVLTSDERADGGGVRVDTLTALQLVRFVPSRWQNYTEIEKERFEPVQPQDARATPGTYLLVHPRCIGAPCSELF